MFSILRLCLPFGVITGGVFNGNGRLSVKRMLKSLGIENSGTKLIANGYGLSSVTDLKNMKFKVEKMKFITREYVRANPKKVFLFGDNLQGIGLGGQAGAMRGEPNAIGIPTKKAPSNIFDAFFTDAEFDKNACAIDAALAQLARFPAGVTLVIPEDGLGTGLADLPCKAPLTYGYLEGKLRMLERDE